MHGVCESLLKLSRGGFRTRPNRLTGILARVPSQEKFVARFSGEGGGKRKNDRWCGYGEAMGGGMAARLGWCQARSVPVRMGSRPGLANCSEATSNPTLTISCKLGL